jgi:hypothetical protein
MANYAAIEIDLTCGLSADAQAGKTTGTMTLAAGHKVAGGKNSKSIGS